MTCSVYCGIMSYDMCSQYTLIEYPLTWRCVPDPPVFQRATLKNWDCHPCCAHTRTHTHTHTHTLCCWKYGGIHCMVTLGIMHTLLKPVLINARCVRMRITVLILLVYYMWLRYFLYNAHFCWVSNNHHHRYHSSIASVLDRAALLRICDCKWVFVCV